jgi:hypothetical protein
MRFLLVFLAENSTRPNSCSSDVTVVSVIRMAFTLDVVLLPDDESNVCSGLELQLRPPSDAIPTWEGCTIAVGDYQWMSFPSSLCQLASSG